MYKRVPYLEKLDSFMGILPRGPHSQQYQKMKQQADEEFYSYPWTVDESRAELRGLAKDLEMAAAWEKQSLRYVRSGMMDSQSDLLIKADFLMRLLLKLDYNEFVLAMSEQGMSELTRKLEIAKQLAQLYNDICSTTVESKTEKMAELEAKRGPLTAKHPESADQINAMIDQEKQRIAEG